MAEMNVGEFVLRVEHSGIMGKFVVMAENVPLEWIEVIQERLNDWARGTDAFCVVPIMDGQALYFDQIIDYEKTAEPLHPQVDNPVIDPGGDHPYHIVDHADYCRLKWHETVYEEAVKVFARGDNFTAWFTGVAYADILRARRSDGN